MNRNLPHIFLAVGNRDHWPAPLAALVAQGTVAVERVSCLHEAAAALTIVPNAYQALLLDLEVLGPSELAMLSVVRRHVSIPLWVLPTSHRSGKLRQALTHGALAWPEVVGVLEQWLQNGSTLVVQSSNRENPANAARDDALAQIPKDPPRRRPDAADNIPPDYPADTREIPMAADIAARYDGLIGQPLLSEHEIRALLGTAE